MGRLIKNVVEALYAVWVKIGSEKYCFRVKAESDATALTKAERSMEERFGGRQAYTVLSMDRIEPGDELA